MLTSIALAAFTGGILWAILGISFLIFIHEYGHYTACRLTGTRTETFAIGFGPRLFGWESAPGHPRRFTFGRRRLDGVAKAMDFRFALIPLGGYVKMAGENPGEERTGAGDEFASKSIPQRLFIVSAGVIMNAVTAFVFYTLCYGGAQEQEAPVVGLVERGGPAWSAGMHPGDRVIAIDGVEIDSFTDLRVEAAFLARDAERAVLLEGLEARREVRVRARYSEAQGVVKIGLSPAEHLTLGKGRESLRIGAREQATVAGLPVVGGTQALAVLVDALDSGLAEVAVRTADGRETTVRIAPRAAGAPAALEKPLRKVGLQPHAPPVVRAVLGAVADLLEPGDRLLAAVSDGQKIDLAPGDAWESLPWRAERIEALLVRRGDAERLVTFPQPAQGRAALSELVESVAFEPHGTEVGPLAPGRLVVAGTQVLRYATIPAAGKVAPGERLVRVAGKNVSTFSGAVDALGEAGAEGPVRLTVRGLDGKEREEVLEPAPLEELGTLEHEVARAKQPLVVDGLVDAIAHGAGRLWRETKNTFRTIGAFFSGNIAFTKNIAGPITLVGVSKKASEESFLDLLWFLAYVSVMLAVLNILPIPVLDGGHVVFLIAEKLRGGRPLPDRVIGNMQLIGLLLLLTLMFFALKNDILLNF